MKKSFLFAVAAAVALFAACSNEENIVVEQTESDVVNVSFTTSLEQALKTRAVAGETNGTQASTLTVAVYNASNQEIAAIRQVKANAFDASLQATVDFQLVKGQTYNFAFWAQNPSATADAVVFDPATGKVTVDYTKIKANDETLDAFTAHVNDLKVTGPVAQSVTLKRPWAQINYGTTPADLKAARLASIDIKQSKVVVDNVYQTLNLLDGTVSNPTTADITLAAANIPTAQNTFSVEIDNATPATTATYGKLHVDNNDGDDTNDDYVYLGLNYLLVGGEADTQSLVKADLELFDANGSVNAIAFSNVPVQRNYRTNIVGNLLTSQVEFNIQIDANYEGDYNPVFSEVKTGITKDGIGNYVVSTEVENAATAINDIITDAKNSGISDVKVTLPDGEYKATLYSGSGIGISSLTIAGNGSTKIAFNNLQVMTSLLDELVIENCEVLHMATKNWGMIVFGASGKANGVYTVRNCTFNGVSTQGIYINETASGATYNIEDCTFDGDFGTEGAITIQNNANVNHTVNIKGCTFSNIPNTSHKVFIIYDYEGWTLKTENNTGLDESDIYWKTKN